MVTPCGFKSHSSHQNTIYCEQSAVYCVFYFAFFRAKLKPPVKAAISIKYFYR